MTSGLNRSAAACSAATSSTAKLLLDEAVAIEVVGRLEGEERGHTHYHGAKSFIADVEVVVGEAATLACKDAVVRVLGGIFRHADAKSWPLLHALEDEIDAVGVLVRYSVQPRQDIVFLANTLLSPLDRSVMIAGIGFHPVLIVGRTLAQDFLADHGNANHFADEVNDLLRP